MNINVKYILSKILNIMHFSLLLIPFIIYIIPIPKKDTYQFTLLSLTLLIMFLTPLHWYLFDGECVFTIWSKKLGDYQDSTTTSGFSETNMKWLYYPIMKIIGLKWDNDGINKMVTLHWILNIIIVWYYIFYRLI
jgi:hypothetical protein